MSRATANTGGAGAILLDSYELAGEEFGLERPLACFYDGGDVEPPAGTSLVVAPQLDAQGRRGWLCGLSFACVRPGYWGAPPVEPSVRVERILVTTGASDPGGAGDKLVSAALSSVPGAVVRRVRGPHMPVLSTAGVVELDAPDDLRSELRAADLVVCLGGQTALEAACLGVPTVAIVAVENQRHNVAQLAAEGAIETASLDDGLPKLVAAVAADASRRTALGRAARRAVDGFGALRVAAALEELLDSG